MELHHENEAWLLSTVRNGGNNVLIFVSLETNLTRKTCTLMEAKTLVSYLVQSFY